MMKAEVRRLGAMSTASEPPMPRVLRQGTTSTSASYGRKALKSRNAAPGNTMLNAFLWARTGPTAKLW